MNQQQATEFIQQQLRQGVQPQEIARQLSQQLQAPPELLAKFIEKVAAQTPPAQPVSSPTPTRSAAPEPTSTLISSPAAFRPPVETSTSRPGPAATAAVETSTSRPGPAGTVPARPHARPASRPSQLDDPKLAEYVAKRLKSQRRKNDIAMEVCERTGVDWKEAQRFVNQVNLEQYQSINRAKNIPILILCGLFVFSGVVMLILGAVNGMFYLSLYQGASVDLTAASGSDIRSTFYLLLGGFGFTIGGLVGFYLSLRQHSE